ncbi:MAG TPA: hypothetical protein VM598_12810, partial [Bdellovibrionota bacterium]|nr:hypothetical protein [Bdellovibrionota bacterium]
PSSRDAATGNDSLDRVEKRQEYGPAIGFTTGNLRLIFTYFLGGTATLSDRSANLAGVAGNDFVFKNHLRNGFQFVLGYSFNVSSAIKLGPSLVYRSVSYKEQDFTDNVTPANSFTGRAFSTDSKEANLLPMISLVFEF